MNLKSIKRKAKNSWLLLKHFQNPFLIPFARMGWINIPYCSYKVRKNGYDYSMLGRLLGGDHRILREVLVEETYRPVLELLPFKPLRVVDIGAHIDPVAHARSSLNRTRHSSPTQHSTIQVLALNEWLEKTPGNFDLLKLDCEGSEWEMLECCPTAFARFSIIVAEVHRDPKGKHDIQDFAAVLGQHGFTTVSCAGLYIERNSDATKL